MSTPATSSLGWQARTGIGFRAPHYDEIIATRPAAVGWFEVHAENYLGGGAAWRQLETVRADWPVSVHGVGLSLASAEGIDRWHLERIAALIERIQPVLISEHLAWSTFDGTYLNDLLPVPYTDEALTVLTRNIARVQERLGRPLLIENPSRYLRFTESPIPEAEFLSELVQRTGCGLLCDVNNIYVTSANVGSDPLAWLKALPAEAVGEIHLAGHSRNEEDGTVILIDDHGAAVAPEVWHLFERAVRRFRHAPVLIEWDQCLPSLSTLVAEATEANCRRERALGEEGYAEAA